MQIFVQEYDLYLILKEVRCEVIPYTTCWKLKIEIKLNMG